MFAGTYARFVCGPYYYRCYFKGSHPHVVFNAAVDPEHRVFDSISTFSVVLQLYDVTKVFLRKENDDGTAEPKRPISKDNNYARNRLDGGIFIVY